MPSFDQDVAIKGRRRRRPAVGRATSMSSVRSARPRSRSSISLSGRRVGPPRRRQRQYRHRPRARLHRRRPRGASPHGYCENSTYAARPRRPDSTSPDRPLIGDHGHASPRRRENCCAPCARGFMRSTRPTLHPLAVHASPSRRSESACPRPPPRGRSAGRTAGDRSGGRIKVTRGRQAETGPGGGASYERHATVICCTAGAMGDRSQAARTKATVSRVIFADATSRSSHGRAFWSAGLRVILWCS